MLRIFCDRGGEGAEIVYALRNEPTLATMALNNIGDAGQIKRQIYQRRLPENPNKDYYYILRETGNTEPLLVEYGFIDNENDARKLKNNLEDYVEGVVKAIADYAGYNYFPPNSIPQNYYVVKRGDTLYSIASKYNTTVQELKRLNNLSTDILTIGMKLLLKETSPSSTYIVKKGDTLYSIANKYNTTVQELKLINNLTSNSISIGQQLIIPTIISPELPEDMPEDIPEIETEIYIVKKGDSLWAIAKNNNITVDELIKLNNLSSINLQIGDQLLIPSKNSNKMYTVQKGDTLWSIAKKNNITVDELKTLNNLTSNLLSVGQKIIISK